MTKRTVMMLVLGMLVAGCGEDDSSLVDSGLLGGDGDGDGGGLAELLNDKGQRAGDGDGDGDGDTDAGGVVGPIDLPHLKLTWSIEGERGNGAPYTCSNLSVEESVFTFSGPNVQQGYRQYSKPACDTGQESSGTVWDQTAPDFGNFAFQVSIGQTGGATAASAGAEFEVRGEDLEVNAVMYLHSFEILTTIIDDSGMEITCADANVAKIELIMEQDLSVTSTSGGITSTYTRFRKRTSRHACNTEDVVWLNIISPGNYTSLTVHLLSSSDSVIATWMSDAPFVVTDTNPPPLPPFVFQL